MIKVGIIGSGNIGTDLLLKLLKQPDIFEVEIVVGRREDSEGIKIAKEKNIRTSINGIDFFINSGKYCDIVFDCTNANDAIENNKVFQKLGIKVIDLTPSKQGPMVVPSVNGVIQDVNNINMITCGGQASLPLLYLISKYSKKIRYIEIVSQISSKSAGMATRINIDGYIETTQKAITQFTGCENNKVILNLNPAEPEVDMQTTMFLEVDDIDYEKLVEEIYIKIKELRKYIPYYELVVPPTLNDGILVLSIKVKGSGDYLPPYAGNLDIINCAAIETAKQII